MPVKTKECCEKAGSILLKLGASLGTSGFCVSHPHLEIVTNQNRKVFWEITLIKYHYRNHPGRCTNKKFFLNAGTYSWHLVMHGVLKTMLNTECIPLQWVPLVSMRKLQFSVCTLSQHTYLLSFPFLLVLVLAPTTLSHLSLPLHPLKIYIMQFVLHTLMDFCLHGTEKTGTLLYLWWSQGRSRTT